MREQFTFYRSFYDALCKLKKPNDQLAVYKAIAAYALYEEEPDLADVPAAIFDLIRPTLDASKRKADNGSRGGKTEANRKQTASKTEANRKQTAREKENEGEKEGEKEKENKNECYYYPPIPPKGESPVYGESFEKFWAAYPKKVGKGDALKAFSKTKVSIDTLVDAVEAQKQSEQWQRENGRYIPNPATWLNQQRWDDELPKAAKYYGSAGEERVNPGELDAEYESLRREIDRMNGVSHAER